MKKLMLSLVAACAAAVGAQGVTLEELSFAYKTELTVAGYSGASEVKDLPVLVRLAEGAPTGFSYATCDKDSLRFADASGNLIPHEIETWNAEGESLIWVKVPSVSGTDTRFVMYFGGTGATCASLPASDVWSNYVAVFHGGTYDNSVGNAITGAAGSDAVTTTETGVLGGGFDKSSCNSVGLNFSNPVKGNSLTLGTEYTCSAWYNQRSRNSNNTAILFADSITWNNNGFLMLCEGGKYISVACDTTHHGTGGKYPLEIGKWTHIAFSYNKTAGSNKGTLKSYFNGENIYSSTSAKTKGDVGNTYWSVGSYSNTGTDDSFCGQMDEIRVFNGIASSDYVVAEYKTVSDAEFVAKSAVELIDLTIVKVVAGDVSADVYGMIKSDAANGPFSVSIACGIGTLDAPVVVASGLAAGEKFSGAVGGLVNGEVYSYKAVIADQSGAEIHSSSGTFTPVPPVTKLTSSVWASGLKQAKFNSSYDKTSGLSSSVIHVEATPGPVMADVKTDESTYSSKGYTNPYTGTTYYYNKQNTTFAYIGYIWLEAGVQYNFAKNIDDSGYIKIGETVVLDNSSYNSYPVVNFKPEESGWYAVDMRCGDGNGGKGPSGGGIGSARGLGYNKDGVTKQQATGWDYVRDAGNDGSFLRTEDPKIASMMSISSLKKSGGDVVFFASFENVPDKAELRAYYDVEDRGDTPALWANYVKVAEIDAGATDVARYVATGAANGFVRIALVVVGTDTAQGRYQFSPTTAFSGESPIVSVSVESVGYTNATVSVTVSTLGGDATEATATLYVSESEDMSEARAIAVDPKFTEPGMRLVELAELLTNTTYYVCASALNNAGFSATSSVKNFLTLTPTAPQGSFLLKSTASTSQTFLAAVTDLGDDSHSAVITMQCATDEDFTEGLCESDPLDIGEDDLDVEKELTVSGLQKNTPYYSRLKIVNAWGLTYYAETFFCPTFDSLVVQGIGYTAVEGGFNVDVVVSYMDGDSATVELFANGVSVGAQELMAAGTASFAVSSAANLTALRAVVTGEITVEKSASAKKGTTQVVIGDPAEHATVATAVKLHAGDGISLPPLMGKASYKVLNQSFLSLDDIVLTAIKPGIVGVEVYGVDGALATTMAVIVLPEKIGSGNIYIRAESNSQDWHSAVNWTTVDGAVAADCPHNADDIAIVPRLSNAQTFKVNSDIALGGLYVGIVKSGASATYYIQRADNMKTIPVVTFERTDGEPVTIQVCGNNQKDAENLRTYLQFGDGNNKLGFKYENDTILDGGWDGIATKLANGRPNYASNCTNEIPAGVTLTWRNIDNTGTSMGCTFDAPVLAGEGTVWNRSAANIKYSRSSGDFTGVIRDSSHGNAGIDRSGPTFFSAATVAKASAEAYGFVYNKSGSPDCNSSCVGMLCTGWDPSYGAPGFHGNYFPECGLTLVNGTFRCGSVENSGWGKGVAEVKYTEKFTIGRGFSYVNRNNNRDNKSGHPINWFETDALAHADKGTIRVDDYHRSNYADVSDTTNTVTILRGFKNFAVGGTGDPKTSENYPIIPWMVTPSYRTDNGKLAFTCADGDDRICDMATRTNRKLDEVTDENENVYANNNTTALTADRTVNSLWIWNQNQEKKFGADRTLTVKSGGVIFRADASSFGTKTGGDANGAVVLGDATKPGYIFAEATNASNPNSIYAKVTAKGGLVFGYTGYALLAGDQTGVDDELVVNAGTLDLGSQDKSVACTLDVPVRILANATVKLNNVEMKDSAVYFDDIAGYSGKIQLNAAETKCLKLYRRDTPEETEWTSLPRGTYSAETHPDLFTGTGTLVVRKDDLAHGMYLIIK